MKKEEFNWLIERLKTEEVVMVNRQGVIDNVHGYIVPLTLSQTYGGISQNLVEQLLQQNNSEVKNIEVKTSVAELYFNLTTYKL